MQRDNESNNPISNKEDFMCFYIQLTDYGIHVNGDHCGANFLIAAMSSGKRSGLVTYSS